MARKSEIPKRDAERAQEMLEIERKNWPTYKQPSSVGSYLILILALAFAGAIVYYALNRKEQIAGLWFRATHPDTVPAQVQPDQ
jgi:hypothetical protein